MKQRTVFFQNRRIIFVKNTENNSDENCSDTIKNINAKLFDNFLLNDENKLLFSCKKNRKAFRQFTSHFQTIEASGGAVFCENKVLAIFRNGMWDLPKGHIEHGEKKRVAALREIEEETGVTNLEISRKIGKTWHIYSQKDRFLLKKTHWYFVNAISMQMTVPQREEGIDKAVWLSRNELIEFRELFWPSLYEIVDEIISVLED